MNPLIVDLDGTLVKTDTLHELAIARFKNNPIKFFAMLLSSFRKGGKAFIKKQLASNTYISIENLPYNTAFLEYLSKEKESGRELVLCTAADEIIANKIASHIGIFSSVIASDGKNNLVGINKSNLLVELFGKKGFDYAGNSKDDLRVWQDSKNAILVNASPYVKSRASKRGNVVKIFKNNNLNFNILKNIFRFHQWLKNLLIFVPMIAAHQLSNISEWSISIAAFISFSLCASAVYIINDIIDLENDRLHPRKKDRPFASGNFPIWGGACIAPIVFLFSFILAANINMVFFNWLAFYFLITTLYSFYIKKIILVDCFVLALLFTSRILAGGAAVQDSISFWLLAFSIFLFLSLAFLKRFSELKILLLNGNTKAHGRGYLTEDINFVQNIGIASGNTAILIFALYFNSDAVIGLYKIPEMILIAIPFMLLWIYFMWMSAHKGKMHDDPLVFAVKNIYSIVLIALTSLVLVISAIGIS